MNRAPSNDSLIGKTLAHFRIDKLLGRGGMAKVYYGWDTTLHRPVAVKVIDERYWGDPAYIYRFVREARAIAALQHANILSVYHADEQNGIPYFVMEYIQGIDLGQLIRQYAREGKLLPHDEVIRIGKAVASALDFAHHRGFIHRDVKPSNVLIADSGRIVLADFGLALKVAQGTLGEVFGSPHYIAPEQVRSSSNAVPQSDLYSLGVMLYEMLTGALPFDDPNPATLAYQHVNQEPPAPRKINPTLNRSVEAVLLKALRKNPKERYLSGQALMEALDKALHRMGSPAGVPLTQPFLPPVEYPAEVPATAALPVAEAVPVTSAEPLPDEPAGLPAGNYEAPPFTAPVLVQPSRRVAPRRRSALAGNRFAWGCAGLILIGLIAAGVIAAIVNNLPGFALSSTPTRTPTQEIQPTATATLEPSPTATSEPTPTPSPSPTLTPTETPTVQPTTTAVINTVRDITLEVARRGEEGLYVINRGEQDFPVSYFWLGNHLGQVSGEAWETEELRPGECLVIWQDKGKPVIPKELNCTAVGEVVRRDKKAIFWTVPFDVYFNNQKVTTCQVVEDRCELKFRIVQ